MSKLGRSLHVTEETVYRDSNKRSYLVIDMVIQSGTTEHSAFVIRMDNKGVFLYKPYQKKRGKIMSGILMMVIAIVVLGGAYLLYGRYLQNKRGIDPKAKTPAYELEDGVDYVPADTNVVFGHQFASIAGAGPINGPIQAAIFGWLPVLLWIPMVFMMAVTFTALGMTITKLSGALFTTGLDMGNTLQLIFAILLLILGVLVAIQGVKKLFEKADDKKATV